MQADYTPQITPEMRARYVTRRRADLEQLEAALKTSDFETLSQIAHQVKGNAATFSFTTLEKAAIALETATESNSLADARQAVAAFRAWLDTQPS